MYLSDYPGRASLESRLRFWTLLGPFFILAAIFVSAYRFFPAGAYMPFLLLLTLPLFVFGSRRLLFLAVSCCFALFVYSYSKVPYAYRVWEMGMLATVALGVWITSLSFKEILFILKEAKVEAKKRLDSLLQMDEQLKKSEVESEKRQDLLSEELIACEQKIQELEDRLLEKQRLVEKYRQGEEKLGEDYLLQQERLEVLEAEKQLYKKKSEEGAVWVRDNSSLRRELEQMKNLHEQKQLQLDSHQKELQGVKREYLERCRLLEEKLEKSQDQVAKFQEEAAAISASVENDTTKDLESSKQQVKELRQQLNQQRVAKFQLKLNHKQLFCQYHELRKKKKKSVQGSYEDLYRQLKKQFYDKDKVLSKTRHALFHSEEEKLKMQREKEEKALQPSELIQAFQRDIEAQQRENEELREELAALHELIKAWSC